MLKKILFACSLISLTIGLSGFGEACQWGLTVPFGAVLFILGFIVAVLEKEMALYDAEQTGKMAGLRPVSFTSTDITRRPTLAEPHAAF